MTDWTVPKSVGRIEEEGRDYQRRRQAMAMAELLASKADRSPTL